MRMPSRSTSSIARNGESAGTAYVPSMTTYGAVKAISPARSGSIARNATSHAPVLTASTALPAASSPIRSTGTPSRRPSSRVRSTDTPRGSPVAASLCASTGFPKLIAARSRPLGATSLATSGRTFPPAVQAPRRTSDAIQTSGLIAAGPCDLSVLVLPSLAPQRGGVEAEDPRCLLLRLAAAEHAQDVLALHGFDAAVSAQDRRVRRVLGDPIGKPFGSGTL